MIYWKFWIKRSLFIEHENSAWKWTFNGNEVDSIEGEAEIYEKIVTIYWFVLSVSCTKIRSKSSLIDLLLSNLREPEEKPEECGEIQETFPIIGPVLIRCVEGTGIKIFCWISGTDSKLTKFIALERFMFVFLPVWVASRVFFSIL